MAHLNTRHRARRRGPNAGGRGVLRLVRATGNLAVAVRTRDVERVFCSGVTPGDVVFADLPQQAPQVVVAILDDVAALDELVARMIR